MALKGVYNSYRKLADSVDWQTYSPNELFRECIKNENDPLLYEAFFSGIMCRYWGLAGRMYKNNNRHIPFEDCYECIVNAANYVLKNRVWEKEDSSLYNDETGPDKAMHVAIKREQGILLAKLNAQKRVSNFNTMSMDEMHEAYKDSADGLFFLKDSSEDRMKMYIDNDYFEKKEFLSGIFLDTICYNSEGEFTIDKVVSEIRKLSNDDYDYFSAQYNISLQDFKDCIKFINSTPVNILRMKLKSLLYSIRLRGDFSYD